MQNNLSEKRHSIQNITSILSTLDSLHQAVESAGGCPKGFTIGYLETISALELLTILGCNNIIFNHKNRT